MNTEQAVRQRYSAAAEAREAELCCPVDYDAKYLKVIPQEVIDRDYGCGDPSKYVRAGETVLDLGSGGGKICFIASQVVGAAGKVIGVDMNDVMLELARRSQTAVAAAVGYDNVHFCKGKIQDMAIDRDAVDAYLKEQPVSDEAGLQRLESFIAEMRTQRPMIADNSVDVVVSNCVLNLVDSAEKAALFAEIFRVLKPGGRAVISDIVSDQPVPIQMQRDPVLWSGCISGALEERQFMDAFADAGFHGIEMPVLQKEAWQKVQGIEFRSATVIAYKGSPITDGPCEDAVIYRGPFSEVVDDQGQRFLRGQRSPTTRGTRMRMIAEPYASSFIGLMSATESDAAGETPAETDTAPSAKATQRPSTVIGLNIIGDDCCGSDGCC
ncbi:arsenite S-adenosylmethyltransferase [Rubripirellula lacrimiformis]|uniref:Arsenite methyltransferase n=1 Tax=Rubripirellula lacrimiformis TaxID=1930273 RepID=A0A517N6D1_9BACT|nr:methyltransferase domain-containing protein [Rubripirellula lacrimiformis]QDT02695.1 arsenite S-adenosylmethyltransferase [Rubripirellula lacrimiformis]